MSLQLYKVKDGDTVRCNTDRYERQGVRKGEIYTIKRVDDSDATLWLEGITGWLSYDAFDPVAPELEIDRIWNAVIEIAGQSR